MFAVARELLLLAPRSVAFVLVALVGVFVVPIALLGRRTGSGTRTLPNGTQRLPAWAQWWDDPINGCYGDAYWQTGHHPTDFKTFYVMWVWLALRNPATGFACYVLGVWGKRIVSKTQHGPLIVCRDDAGKTYVMIDSQCPRLLIGPDNTNVKALNTFYWYPFQLIVQPWVCRE